MELVYLDRSSRNILNRLYSSKLQLTRLIQFLFLYTLICFNGFSQGAVGIGTNVPDESAILDVFSNNRGILIPRVDGNDLIPNPIEGLMIYNIQNSSYEYYDGSNWIQVISTPAKVDLNMGTSRINMSDNRITNVADGTDDGDVMNKGQTEAIIETISQSTAETVLADDGILNDGNTSGNSTTKIKIIEIGDWNMTSTLNVFASHGLVAASIRSVTVVVRRDAGGGSGGQISQLTNVHFGEAGWFFNPGGSVVALFSPDGGFYDSSDYDQTSYNRGWVTIIYEE